MGLSRAWTDNAREESEARRRHVEGRNIAHNLSFGSKPNYRRPQPEGYRSIGLYGGRRSERFRVGSASDALLDQRFSFVTPMMDRLDDLR